MRAPPQGPISQDDFDGKRLRKSVMRKTVDYNAAIVRALEARLWQRDWRDRPALQPDSMYAPLLLPPPHYPDNPTNAVTTRFVKTATNKMRCPIFSVAWTPEGRRLVTGASSGEFTLWNGLTFNFETILQAHDSPVRSMVWSRGEGWMVTGDHAGYVKYWQSNMNNVKMFQAHKEAVRGISFSPTDAKIVTCSDDGTLRIFDFYRCQEERILRGHGSDVKCVQWHPTKGLIVSGSKDNQQPIKLWDPKSGQALATLHAHKSTVMDLKWNDNGNWLITASRDHLLKLFDIRKMGTELQVFRGHKKEASSVAWHPNHEGLFCSGGSDGAILFWNVGTDKEVGSIEDAHESIVWTLAWHPLGHILCSGSNDHTSKFWTRNRPGDLMRDKYNLNTLPPGVQDEQDLEDPSMIPGMGPEDKVEMFTPTEEAIPGLDLDTSVIPLDNDKKGKKVPYSKPIPRNFQAHWNHAPGEDSSEALAQALVEAVPGVVPLQQIAPSAIIIYGKLVPVEPGSKLEAAIADGPKALKKFIASGEIEELHDVMPHIEDDEDDSSTQFLYPNALSEDRESIGSPFSMNQPEEEREETFESPNVPNSTNQDNYFQFQTESFDNNSIQNSNNTNNSNSSMNPNLNYNNGQSTNYSDQDNRMQMDTSNNQYNRNFNSNDGNGGYYRGSGRGFHDQSRGNFNQNQDQSHFNNRQYNNDRHTGNDYDTSTDMDQREEPPPHRYNRNDESRESGNWGFQQQQQRNHDMDMQHDNPRGGGMINGHMRSSGFDRGRGSGDRGRGGPGMWRNRGRGRGPGNARTFRRPSRNNQY
ncbi:WD repeat domain 33 [Arctopsyche grandis]|uniref:WD repeat domain 33 n=1 Tax=Arctopsyche grandis TaxID=121162 RepID=UPI00406D8A46